MLIFADLISLVSLTGRLVRRGRFPCLLDCPLRPGMSMYNQTGRLTKADAAAALPLALDTYPDCFNKENISYGTVEVRRFTTGYGHFFLLHLTQPDETFHSFLSLQIRIEVSEQDRNLLSRDLGAPRFRNVRSGTKLRIQVVVVRMCVRTYIGIKSSFSCIRTDRNWLAGLALFHPTNC